MTVLATVVVWCVYEMAAALVVSIRDHRRQLRSGASKVGRLADGVPQEYLDEPGDRPDRSDEEFQRRVELLKSLFPSNGEPHERDD